MKGLSEYERDIYDRTYSAEYKYRLPFARSRPWSQKNPEADAKQYASDQAKAAVIKSRETFLIPYTIVTRPDGWAWKHDVTGKEPRKTYPTRIAAILSAKAAFMQSRQNG